MLYCWIVINPLFGVVFGKLCLSSAVLLLFSAESEGYAQAWDLSTPGYCSGAMFFIRDALVSKRRNSNRSISQAHCMSFDLLSSFT